MAEQRAHLRIREGAFAYLLAASEAVSIERRNRGAFEPEENASSVIVTRLRVGSDSVPVIRLGSLLATPAGEWEYAILLSDGSARVGVAAEHIYLIPEPEVPVVQPFNPAGSRLPGGSIVTGLCPHTDPEYLVLDLGRLQRSLRRVAGLQEGG